MSRDYVRRPQNKRQNSAPKRLFLILTSFLCGYLVATVFDFTSLSSWVKNNILNQNNNAPHLQAKVAHPPAPKPKFEFYTLLSKDSGAPTASNHAANAISAKIGTAQNVTTQSHKASTNTTAEHAAQSVVKVVEGKAFPGASLSVKDAYLIQIAAFNKRQDAEHLKASLVLNGFNVNIAPVAVGNVIWYRVITGPFRTLPEAQKAQIGIARVEHMKGVIRKVAA